MSADVSPVECPRCGATAEVRYYGPCDECRAELRDVLGGPPTQIEPSAYEPKMNVTPNAVALKE